MADEDKKYKFLLRVYFGVSDNPKDDVNPYTDLKEFEKANVGSLRWGIDPEAKQRSKIRFAYNYCRVLQEAYNLILKMEDILPELIDEKINSEIVKKWVTKVNF